MKRTPSHRARYSPGFGQLLLLGVMLIFAMLFVSFSGRWHKKNADFALIEMMRTNLELIQRNVQATFDCDETRLELDGAGNNRNSITCSAWNAYTSKTGEPNCYGGDCFIAVHAYGAQYAHWVAPSGPYINAMTDHSGVTLAPQLADAPSPYLVYLRARCPFANEKDETGVPFPPRNIILEMQVRDQADPIKVHRWNKLLGLGRDQWMNVFGHVASPDFNPFTRQPPGPSGCSL